MPYITQIRRAALASGDTPQSEGELNYAITRLVTQFIGASPNYANINAAIGALECAKLEMYRRIATPYEEIKREINGDVY